MYSYGLANNINDLQDVHITEGAEWPGPFAVAYGTGAPGAGTGVVGGFYLDVATYNLYGPKASNNTWPLIGGINTTWAASAVSNPVGPNPSGTSWFLRTVGGLPSAVYGPYNADGLNTSTPLVYNPATSQWVESTGRFLTDTHGGGQKASSQSSGGDTFLFGSLASVHVVTMTGNISLAPATYPAWEARQTSNARESRLTVVLIQDGTGGRTVTAWPSNITWEQGFAPVINTLPNARTVLEFSSFDNGSTWLGTVLSQPTDRVTTKTDDYTFGAADKDTIVVLNNSTAKTFTIPTNATTRFPVGTRITVTTTGAGNLTVAGAVGVTLHGTTAITTTGHHLTLIKVDTDMWCAH